MISFIRGRLEDVLIDCIVVESNGVGFEIRVPGSVLQSLPQQGEEVKIYTYLHVREDEMSLFGFASREEQNIFKQLITVNGIGPKGGLAILSTLSLDELRIAVMNEDAKAISASPGIGLKTAQKLIIELKGKLGELADASNAIPKALQTFDTSGSRSEAIAALVALGYSNTEAVAAVRKVEYVDGMDSEAVLKASLKHLTFM